MGFASYVSCSDPLLMFFPSHSALHQLGSIIIALNGYHSSFYMWTLSILTSVSCAGPKEASIGQIEQFKALFLFPGFLVYMSVLIAASLTIIFYFAPRFVTPLHASHSLKHSLMTFALRYGKKSMLWYIFVCSMIGGISVSVTTGLGAAIVQTALGDNQVRSQSTVLVTCLLFYISLNTHSCISCWDL